MEEQWKLIDGTSFYYISNLGRVKSAEHDIELSFIRQNKSMTIKKHYKEKILNQYTCGGANARRNYKYVRLYTKEFPDGYGVAVHRLVANAFIPGYFENAEVRHINGDKFDNSATNLEWIEHKDNMNLEVNKEKISVGAKCKKKTHKPQFYIDHPNYYNTYYYKKKDTQDEAIESENA